MDNANLWFENTHALSSLYETFSPEQAFRLAQKLEIHFTPKHGSWLDIAELELSALAVLCLGMRRIGDIQALNRELSAWHSQRNRKQKGENGSSPPPMLVSSSKVSIRRLLNKLLVVTTSWKDFLLFVIAHARGG
ncbi:MAG: transposase [Treponema sp.]|jgi:hypothetical protein|nr:transposase [Treponema sp.]